MTLYSSKGHISYSSKKQKSASRVNFLFENGYVVRSRKAGLG